MRGYLGGNSYRLFLTEAHEKMNDTASSISVVNPDFKETALSYYCRGYAMVEGTVQKFSDTPINHANQIYFYIIGDLRRVVIYPEDGSLRQCWPEPDAST